MNRQIEEYIKKLYDIVDILSDTNSEINSYIDDISEYTITEEDEDDFDDGLKPGDILSHLIFGNFAAFIRDKIESNSLSDIIIKHFVNLIDEMFNSDDIEVENLVNTGFLEVLTDTEDYRKKMREVLSGKSLEKYEQMIEYWYGPKARKYHQENDN